MNSGSSHPTAIRVGHLQGLVFLADGLFLPLLYSQSNWERRLSKSFSGSDHSGASRQAALTLLRQPVGAKMADLRGDASPGATAAPRATT